VHVVLQMRVVHRLSYASTLEARQHSLLPAWQWPTWLMFSTWLVVHIYSFIRYNLYGGSPWQHVTLWVSTRQHVASHHTCRGGYHSTPHQTTPRHLSQ